MFRAPATAVLLCPSLVDGCPTFSASGRNSSNFSAHAVGNNPHRVAGVVRKNSHLQVPYLSPGNTGSAPEIGATDGCHRLDHGADTAQICSRVRRRMRMATDDDGLTGVAFARIRTP